MTLAAGDNEIRTERLVLRRITPADRPFYERIHADPDVARYIAHGKPRSPEETRVYIEQMVQCYEQTGLGQLAVTLKADGTLIGRCGLSYVELDEARDEEGARVGYYFPAKAPAGTRATLQAELGYTFDPRVWGNGYASEAAGAVHQYAITQLKRRGITSFIHADNVRSIKLAERFAATQVDRVSLWGRTFKHYLWPDS